MAIPAPPDPIHDNIDLHERTNYPTHASNVFTNGNENGTTKTLGGKLHRTPSLRRLMAAFNSSDTLSSSPEYIFDAEVVSENTSPPATPSKFEQTEVSPPALIKDFSTTPFFMSASFQPSPPHSGWPSAQLEPIIERSMQGRLRNSASLPKLRSSPERKSNIVRPMTSVQSICPAISSSPPIQPTSQERIGTRLRSFSLNDLDCLPKSDTDQAWLRRQGQRSSSSDEILRALRMRPIFPLRPTHSPPYRSPTPPGLPSFSTREAEEYRLTPPSPPNRAVALLQRWLGHPYEENDDRFLIASNPSSSPTSPVLPSASTSPPMNMLQRMLGVTRLVHSPQQRDNPRSRLPAGIRVAALPGALIQAEDGTWVRGRWTSRVSSHRIGTRPLDEHPMAHAAGLHSIDEVAREIDKACQAADENDASRQMDATRTSLEDATEIAHRTTLALRPRSEPSRQSGSMRGVRGTEILNSTSRAERQVSQSPFTPLTHDERSMSENSLRSPVNADGVLPAAMSVQHTSTTPGGIAGFRDYVEQGEREHARQSLADRKQKHHRSQECWERFWSFCCCMTANTHGTATT